MSAVIKNCFRTQGGSVIDFYSPVRKQKHCNSGKSRIPSWDETMPKRKETESVTRLRGNNRFTD